MGTFNCFKQALSQLQNRGCTITPQTDRFVSDYGQQVEDAAQALRQKQAEERAARSMGSNLGIY